MGAGAAALDRAMAAFGAGDMEAFAETVAPDAVWHFPGRSQLAGEHEGREEILALLGRVAELTQGTFRLDPHAVIEDEEHLVLLVTVTASRGDAALQTQEVSVFHVEDDRLGERWILFDDLYAVDDFFG